MPAGDSAEAGRFVRTPEYARITAQNRKKARARNEQYVISGRKAKPRRVGGGDPVLGFLESAAKVIGGQVKQDAGDWWQGAKIAERALDRYGRERLGALIPDRERRTVRLNDPRQQQALAITTPMREGLLQLGKFFIKPQNPMSLGQLSSRLPKTVAGRPRAMMTQLPEEATGFHGDPGVGNRIPWLVNNRTGQVVVGREGESHGALGWKLGRRGVDVRRKPIGSLRPDYTPVTRPGEDFWMEGWLNKASLREDPQEMWRVMLSARGGTLDEIGMPENRQGLDQLIRYLTDDLVDDEIYLTNRMREQLTTIQERQGQRAEDLLQNLGGPMSPKEMQEFMQQELKRRKRKR